MSTKVVEQVKKGPASDKAKGTAAPVANVDAAREAKRARAANAVRNITGRWKATPATKNLFDFSQPVDTTALTREAFRTLAYELLAQSSKNKMTVGGPDVTPDDKEQLIHALTGEVDREPYAQALIEAMQLESKDRPHLDVLGDTLDNLLHGGDVKWNTRELLGHYAPLSSDGKKFVAKAPRTLEFKKYIDSGACGEHGALEKTHVVKEKRNFFFEDEAEEGAKERIGACRPLAGLLERGALGAAPTAAKAPDPKAPTDGTATVVAPGTAPVGEPQPDPIEKAADELLARIKTAIEKHSSLKHDERKIHKGELKKLFADLKAADEKVKDRLYAKSELMQQLLLLDPEQMKELVKRLDTVQGLYETLHDLAPHAEGRKYEGAPQAPMLHEKVYPTLEKFLTDRPGKSMAPARLRVLQHEQLKTRFIDTMPEAQRKLVFKLIASGTLLPTDVDKLRDAARAGQGGPAAEALMKVSNDTPDELAALRDDHIFRKEIENVDKEISVGGMTVNPYHLCLTFWGLEPLSTKDVTVDERQQEVNPHGTVGADGKVLYRPLTIEERMDLETNLLDPYSRRLRSEIAETIVDDDDMKSICQKFERDSAGYIKHFQTMGKAPGPALTEYYNKKYQGHDLRGEVNEYVSDSEMVECERILGFRIDSATAGIINGKVVEHGKGSTGNKVGLAQALRETLNDKGVPLSQVTSDYALRLSEWMWETQGSVFFQNTTPGCSKDELIKSWHTYRDLIVRKRPEIAQHTTLGPEQIHPIELIVNAVHEKGGDLTKKIQRFFGWTAFGRKQPDSDLILEEMGLTPKDVAARAQAASGELMANDPEKGIEQKARETYAAQAASLFESLSKFPPSLDLTLTLAIATSFKSIENHKLAAVPVVGGGPATKTVEERPPRSFRGFYRLEYGIDPRDQVARVLKSHQERGKDVTAVAEQFGVEVAGEPLPPDEELIIDHKNQHLVRHNFTAETANGIARELWNAIHEGTRLNAVITKLYTDFAAEEQRLIRIAFRRLSGGLDLTFYIQQKLQQVRGGGVTAIGAEGTRETQGEGFTKKKDINLGDSDVNRLEIALSAAQHGTVDTYAMLRSAANNRDVDTIMRLADETEQADRAKILQDNDLMDKLRAACDAIAWDRVYKVLTNQADLVDRLYQRGGGLGTDEKGMREDIKAHVKRLRKRFDKDVRAEETARIKSGQPQRSPDQLDEAIKARVKEECQRLMANISVRRIIEEELSADELSDVESLILNAGETNTQADVLRSGKESDTIIAGIRNTPPQERARLRGDAAYLEKLALRLTNPDDYREAMDALMSDRAGEDKLEKIDAHATKKEPREMLRDLVDLDAGELKRLQADPDMQAKMLAAFSDPDQRALARKILTTKLVEPDPKAPPDKQQEQAEAQRIKFLVDNARNRLRVAGTDKLGWPTMLEQCIEVYKMELEHRVAEADESGRSVLVAFSERESAADRTHRQNTAQALRRAIWKDVQGDVTAWASVAEKDKPKRTLSEVWTAHQMIDVVRRAVLHEHDPSSERVLNNLGATVKATAPGYGGQQYDVELDDNHGELLVAIRGASDQILVDEWSNVRMPSVTDGPSLSHVYADYLQAKNAAKPKPGTENESPEQAKALHLKRLAFMNYTLDISTKFEEMVLPHVGSSDERKLTKDGGTGRLRERDNKKYNELLDAARERIVNLTKRDARFLVAKAINLESDDFSLIDQPNRDAITAFEYRDSKFLRSRGTQAGSGWAASDEAAVVDQRMMQYGHEVAEAQTNKEGGAGIITQSEGTKLEERGAEFDRALQAFKDAKAKVAFWMSLIVGVLVTAILTVLTGGLATGPLAALFFTTAIAGISAGAKALVNEAVLAEDYDLKDEGVQMIGKEMLTAFITAGTTMIASKMVAGVAGVSSLGRQARVAEQVMRKPPPLWQGFLHEASEEVLSETMSGTIDAALIAIDPVHWMHGVAEGRDRALPAAWQQLKSAPVQGLKGGMTSMLTAGVMRMGKGKKQLQEAVEQAGKGGRVNIRANFKKVFGGNSERVIATFVEFAVGRIEKGKLDLENVPADLLEGFLQEVNETSMETHTGTAHEKSRSARAKSELDKNKGKLTEQEEKDFKEMHDKAGSTDPYVSIVEYVRVRQNMAADAVFEWSQRNPGKTLTEAQIKAYIMWCRDSADAETFQKRVHTDPDLVEVVQKAKTEVKAETKTESGKTVDTKADAKDAAPKQPPVVEVQTVATVEEGYAIMRRLAGGDGSAVQDAGEGRTDAVEWGLGRKQDGSIVILKGKQGEVDFDHIPGIVALAHSHPAVMDGKPRDLAAATKNPTGIPIGDLMQDSNSNDLVKFLPSTGDLGYFADNTIGSHVVFTPYVHMGDGRVGNPNGQVPPSQRIEIVVNNAHLVGRSAIQKHQPAYSATIIIRTGDGQVLWTGPMYAVKIAGGTFKADQPSLGADMIEQGMMPEPKHEEDDSKPAAGSDSAEDMLAKFATPKKGAKKQKVAAGKDGHHDAKHEDAPGTKRPSTAAEVFAGQKPNAGELWTFKSASGNFYSGRFQGVDQNGHIVLETEQGIGRLDPARLDSARLGTSVPALHGYGPHDRITLYSIRGTARTGVIVGYDEAGHVLFQRDDGQVEGLRPDQLDLRRTARAPMQPPAPQQEQAPAPQPQQPQQQGQQGQQGQQQPQQQPRNERQQQQAPAVRTAADVFGGETPQKGETWTLRSASGNYYVGQYQGIDETGRVVLLTKNGVELYNVPRLDSARRGASIRELHQYGPHDRITLVSVNNNSRTGVILGYDDDGNVRFQKDSGEIELLNPERLQLDNVQRAPALQKGQAQGDVSDHAADGKTSGVVHVGEDAAAHIALATQLGVMPHEVVSVGGATFKIGKLFDIGDGRVAALFEVEVKGQRYMRVAYRSNSQGGFRVLPARNQGVPYMPGYDKAIGEHAIMVPNEVEEALSRNLVADKVRRDIPQEQADRVFEGAVPVNRNMGDWMKFQDSPDHIKNHVTEEKILGEAKDTVKTANGGNMAVPNQVAIADNAHRPNFKQMVRSYPTSTSVAGNVTAMVYRSNDGSLEYVLYKDDQGRVWFKSVSKVDSEITAQGVSAVAIDADALCTPLWEYAKQVPHGYAGARHPTQPNYVDAWKYLSQMPEIRAFYKETGTPMPGEPGVVQNAADRPTQPMQAVADPTAQTTQRAQDPAQQAQAAVQQTPELPAFRDLHADFASLAHLSALPDAVIGPHQAARVPAALRAMSDADYAQFRVMHDALQSPMARGYLMKAVAAHNSIGDLQWLASEMAFKEDAWLLDALTLGDPRSVGVGVRQQWSMSCNASTTITLRGNYDPIFALRLRYSNPSISQVDPNNPMAWNQHLAGLEANLLQSPYQGTSNAQAQGTSGVATPLNDTGPKRGRWADDILSRQSDVTGMTFGTQKDPSGDQALATIDRAVAQGMQVPVVVGDDFGQYTHYVLCMSRRMGAAGPEYQFHNTGDGTTTWVTAAQLRDGMLPLNGGRMITAMEVPTATAMPAETTAPAPTVANPQGVPTASPSSITRPMAAVTVEDAPSIATTAVAVVSAQVAPTALAATLSPSGQTSPEAKGEQQGPTQIAETAAAVPPVVANAVQMIVHGRALHAAQQLQALEAQAAMAAAQPATQQAKTPGTDKDAEREAFTQSWKGKPADLAQFREFFDVGYEDAIDKVRRAFKNPQIAALLAHVPEDELAAIVLYTQTYFVEMNSAIRNKDKAAMKEFGNGIKLADEGLAKMPSHQGWVHRGVESLPDEVLAKYVPGVVVTEEAFTSTSQQQDAAFTGKVKFKMLSKSGRDVQALSRVEAEKEVLFRPGTKFLVTDKERDGDTIVITMEEVVEAPGGTPGDPSGRQEKAQPPKVETRSDRSTASSAHSAPGGVQVGRDVAGATTKRGMDSLNSEGSYDYRIDKVKQIRADITTGSRDQISPDVSDEAIARMKQHIDKLSDEELAAIQGYSSQDYEVLNKVLRDPKADPEKTAAMKGYLGAVRTGLEKLPAYEGEVYRGTALSQKNWQKLEDAYASGEAISDPAFSSSSENPDVAEEFLERGRSDGKVPVFFTIQSRTGKQIEFLSKTANEAEVLFVDGVKFKVIAIDDGVGPDGNERKEVFLREIVDAQSTSSNDGGVAYGAATREHEAPGHARTKQTVESIQGTAQRPLIQPAWQPNKDGAVRTVDQARAIAEEHGVDIDGDFEIRIAPPRLLPPGTYARYFQAQGGDPDRMIQWKEFFSRWRDPDGEVQESVFIHLSPDVLNSDEAIVAVLAHEMHELNELRRIFKESGGAISARRLAQLINVDIAKNLHDQAWTAADEAVLAMRQRNKDAK